MDQNPWFGKIIPNIHILEHNFSVLYHHHPKLCTWIKYKNTSTVFSGIFFPPAHGYRLILLIRLIKVFFSKKKLGKKSCFKQNYEKNWNISLITQGHFKHNRKRKNNLWVFLTKRKLIKCNFFHSYKLLTLFSLYLYQWQLNTHTQESAV